MTTFPENYGTWEVPYSDYPQLVNASAYSSICNAVVNQVKAVSPEIKVGCVGDLTETASPFKTWL